MPERQLEPRTALARVQLEPARIKWDVMLSKPQPTLTPSLITRGPAKAVNKPCPGQAAKSAVPGCAHYAKYNDVQVRTSITFNLLNNMANASVHAIIYAIAIHDSHVPAP